jgi:hypothetical protein
LECGREEREEQSEIEATEVGTMDLILQKTVRNLEAKKQSLGDGAFRIPREARQSTIATDLATWTGRCIQELESKMRSSETTAVQIIWPERASLRQYLLV